MNKRQKIVQEEFLGNEERVIKRLKQVYNQSLKDITTKVSDMDRTIEYLQKVYNGVQEKGGLDGVAFEFFDKIGNGQAKHYANNPEKAKERLQSMIQSKVYQKNYQEALKKQVGDILDNMHAKEFKTVSDYLNKCYEEGFLGTMYDLHGQGIPLCFPMDQAAMVRAVQLDSKISQGLYSRLGEDVNLLKKKIVAQVSRGISTGMSFQQVAKQLAGYTNIGFNNAVRIARTEGHRLQVQSAMDACYNAKEMGADIVKQWDAALDKRTRESHARVDGEIRELDEPFSNGLMFPSDPSGGAAEVVNCRCALLQRARWALDEDELKALQERAEYYGLDKTKDFDDFKKKYLKAAEQVKNETAKPFVPAKTIEEAENFIKQYVDDTGFGALGVSYKGISVEVANEINRTISNVFDNFKLGKFGGIVAPAGNTKLGKLIEGAVAGYSPVRNSFLLNRKSLKDMKTALKSFAGEVGSMKNLLEHPERYDFSKLSKRVRDVIERSKVSGRATVPTNIEEAITHELGHMLEKQVYKSPHWEEAVKNMPKYADKISGYAGESKAEYVAESFASYMKGEKDVDPVLVKIFESLKR